MISRGRLLTSLLIARIGRGNDKFFVNNGFDFSYYSLWLKASASQIVAVSLLFIAITRSGFW
jgi:hypothetical protein